MAFAFDHLPLEILQGILYHLDIPDILRLRRVSQYLNQVSHYRGVWGDVYRRADFIRPPGPFLSQSAHDLECALVPSYRAHRSLRQDDSTTQREKPTLKIREIRYTGVDLCVSLVFGRFLFIALSEEVRCYDLSLDAFDSKSGAAIIYRSARGILKSFHCVTAIDVDGRPFACAVLSEATRTGFYTQISIHSLNVGERSEPTLDLLYQFEHDMFDINVVNLGPRVIVIQGRAGPGIDTEWRLIALDVHARTQFLVPSFTNMTPWEIPEWITSEEITLPTSISTSTHLILARSFYTQAAGWSTFLQAFTLPELNAHHCSGPPLASLSPSHSGIISGINVRGVVLLRDAVVDASTRDILITLRVHAFEPLRPRSPLSKYGILRLSCTARGTSESASPRDALGTVSFRVLGPLGQFARTPFLHPSFNGAGRAFYTLEPGSNGIVAALEYNICSGSDGGCGGANDDEDPVAKVVEHPSILRFPTPRTLMDYDPYSGRICLRSVMAKYSVIEILDLAV